MSIASKIAQVRHRINEAEQLAGRQPGDVVLQLAAKYQPLSAIIEALEAGVCDFGQNIVSQLVDTEIGLAKHGAPAHSTTVIGHVQSNKLARAMDYASRIDTVDSLQMATRIARRQSARINAGYASGPFSVLIQVNSASASSQYGVRPDHARMLAEQIADLDLLRLEGLMTIGAHTDNEADIRRSFALTRALLDSMTADGTVQGHVLSMGMTHDLELAIAEGSTLVRVGTAVFGPRPAK
ncbi:YggS family pyridoxal phosphate-dependent enzyme [Arcanobacterium canis]|uniref:Pyridoxal phosphate homeostasis protein n=1 Tax=Arcanobacterium canis TaxID=999183 RepID=A0ABY8FWN3_9ACTO|nr:YggS family pyridoxal phosphate-dependent enzyme [Arcanobacterium canis]WFM82929.1 YggS family pyridoxal phosphate-dependent enzyme [Arcanobacterium canis]